MNYQERAAMSPSLTPEELVLENQDWLDALQGVLLSQGPQRAQDILRLFQERMLASGVSLSEATLNTPYRNSIPVSEQPRYPGNQKLEEQLEQIIRWNAMAMVLRASDSGAGVGGHIATYLSTSTFLEVGFNHYFKRRGPDYGGDLLYIQAHASPGIYARAFLEGRLTEQQLINFRRELQPGGGLSSYPHPRRMPDFWQGPTASMGLSTPIAIYQARFMKYLENRRLKPANGGKVWCVIGDGESDEPEVMGTINMATRERLDNLILVINCNLQRLDGPVRGNGKIIQELERGFRGADWEVIKVIWGSEWDGLFARDTEGVLQARMDRAVDGDYQYYSVSDGPSVRDHWVRDDPRLEELMKTLSDEQIRCIKRGGHDRNKIFAAFDKATKVTGKPVVILMKTVKGDGMGPTAEGQNTSHQKKQLSEQERIECGRRFGIPLDDKELARAAFYLPGEHDPAVAYMKEKREALGGQMPSRAVHCPTLPMPADEVFQDAFKGSGNRAISTTMAFVRMLSKMLKDPGMGRYVVPIFPDEARTFGMEALFKQAGIYSSEGQKYEPVDASTMLPYKEQSDGQLLQEGICETGAMASFLAAGTAYANFGVPTIPFYIFYSIFGFQRVGDMIWACADNLAKGFLLGGTAGRTTLNGEGVQHQDGHSHVVAGTIPNLVSYDPAFGYELAEIVRDGIKRMYVDDENIFYYLTVYNENYPMPAAPTPVPKAGILKGMYRVADPSAGTDTVTGGPVHILASGSLMQQALKARELLSEMNFNVSIWSVTSYSELLRDAQAIERHNRLDPEHPRKNYLEELLGEERGVFVAVSDYLKQLPNSIARWIPGSLQCLGTEGFGVSEKREDLRAHFEISAEYIAWSALAGLYKDGHIKADTLAHAKTQWRIDSGKIDPSQY